MLACLELRMWPVAAPHHAMHAKGRFQETESFVHLLATFVIIRPVPVRPRYLDPHALCVSQLEKTAKPRVADTQARIRSAEMVYDHVYVRLQKRLDDALQPRSFRVHFD